MSNDPNEKSIAQVFLERVYAETSITEEDVYKVFDKKAENAGFFKRGIGKKLRKKTSNPDMINYRTKMVVGCYEEQHKEKIDWNPLAVIEGFFVVNGGIAEAVLLIYEDKAFIMHMKFGASFGLIGLAANAHDMIKIMPIDLPKLAKENPLTDIKPFTYLHYGRYAFYVYSPFEVIYGLLMARNIVKKKTLTISGEEIIKAAKKMSI